MKDISDLVIGDLYLDEFHKVPHGQDYNLNGLEWLFYDEHYDWGKLSNNPITSGKFRSELNPKFPLMYLGTNIGLKEMGLEQNLLLSFLDGVRIIYIRASRIHRVIKLIS